MTDESEPRNVSELGPLGALGVTYRREPLDASDALEIQINGRRVGRITVLGNDERALLDLVVYALAGNGARER